MDTKFKIELDGSIVRYYYWRKIFWIWGEWIPFVNRAYGSAYDAYVDYDKTCTLINPLWKPDFKP